MKIYKFTEVICPDDDSKNAAKKYVKKVEKRYGVKARIIEDVGPNGECPTIEFTGSKKQLADLFVHDFHAADTMEEALDNYDGVTSFDQILADENEI